MRPRSLLLLPQATWNSAEVDCNLLLGFVVVLQLSYQFNGSFYTSNWLLTKERSLAT